ncbi:hypothetical protein [Tissierella sp. Yu-01]|uniref:hypothetical protein n=1 Tax=Tissierella sp. Yu-01 TaxID=3035694 RepID=UPI00240D7AA1|nr:hypothetical protein [Tissierella sp. Yu-01]WFA08873.1 hypothetical protein P3962_14280 [Tissierella sp. Yu-01]
MSKFDIDEQKIYDMFSQISVDSSKIAEQVKTRLHKENTKIPIKNHRHWTKSAVAAIVMSVVLVATATATALGGFDWFIERFNPDFSEILEPVENYSEDQGIRMEVIGAQKYDNRAIVYLSLQDTTGQNRLTEQTEFRDGFSVKMNPRIIGENGEFSTSMSWKQKIIYFNEDTNTIYYEFNITADPDSPLSNPLELGSFLIYFDGREYVEEPISISLAEIKDAETTSIKEDNIWGGSGIGFDDYSSFTEVLTPGYYIDMPHGEKDQWVSNAGIIDGKLHVQIGRFSGGEFGSSDAALFLMDKEGNLISPDYGLILYGDENNRLLSHEEDDPYDMAYKYNEYVFSVSAEDLNKYTLCFNGTVYTGVEGSWKLAANLSDSNKNICTWTNDISVEGHLFENITLSPLGVQVRGTYEGDDCMASHMKLEIETVDGIISLEGGGGSQNPEKHTFNSSWDANAPLDITKVTAIIINGTSISIK